MSRPRRLSQHELLDLGADGHLTHAYRGWIPLTLIIGLEPMPAAAEGRPYRKGQAITQPIEVEFDPDQGETGEGVYVLYAGNHRVEQARINSQTHILAFVQPSRGRIGPISFHDPDAVCTARRRRM